MATDGRENGGTSPYVSDTELAQRLKSLPAGEPVQPISATHALEGARTSPFGSDMELARILQEREHLKADPST